MFESEKHTCASLDGFGKFSVNIFGSFFCFLPFYLLSKMNCVLSFWYFFFFSFSCSFSLFFFFFALAKQFATAGPNLVIYALLLLIAFYSVFLSFPLLLGRLTFKICQSVQTVACFPLYFAFGSNHQCQLFPPHCSFFGPECKKLGKGSCSEQNTRLGHITLNRITSFSLAFVPTLEFQLLLACKIRLKS